MTTPKAVDFYLHWVRQLHRFSDKSVGDSLTREEIKTYLKHLAKSTRNGRSIRPPRPSSRS